jgi:hypothetical protein
MLAYFATPVRAAVLAAALTFAATGAFARATAADLPRPAATARATARTQADTTATARDDAPLGGVLIIVGIVGVVILLAWVCSRVADSR